MKYRKELDIMHRDRIDLTLSDDEVTVLNEALYHYRDHVLDQLQCARLYAEASNAARWQGRACELQQLVEKISAAQAGITWVPSDRPSFGELDRGLSEATS